MAEAPDELWHDVSVVLKHVRFIVALFVGAILVALATGLVADPANKATSEAQIVIEASGDLSGGIDTAPTLETLETLPESDDVVQAAAQALGLEEAAIKNEILSVTADGDLRDAENPVIVSIVTGGPSQEQAEAIAGAVIEAFAEAVQNIGADPEALDFLRKQEALVRQRLESGQEGLLELTQVQRKLGSKRRLLTSLTNNLLATDRALALLEAEGSRPLAELVVAISGVPGLQDSVAIGNASSVAELKRGLQLRRELIEQSAEETQLEVDALAEREQELLASTADVSAVASLQATASRNLAAADLAAELTQMDVTITKRGVDSSGGLSWLARLGAAAAFGLVAGVAGAFALEFLTPHWRRWRGRADSRRDEA